MERILCLEGSGGKKDWEEKKKQNTGSIGKNLELDTVGIK